MANKRMSDGEYYGKAVTWALVGIAGCLGFVLLVYFSTGTLR